MATLQGERRSSPLKSAVIDGSILAGGGLLTYGAYLTYAPAGFIVAGLLLLGIGIAGASR